MSSQKDSSLRSLIEVMLKTLKKTFTSTSIQNLLSKTSSTLRIENKIRKMDNVYVQRIKDKDMLIISFVYNHEGKSKSFNLYRKGDEPLALSLERIKLNLKKLEKTKKPAQEEDSSNLRVDLILGGSNIDSRTVKNSEAWVEGALLQLSDKTYEVKTNYPGVESLSLPSRLMRDFVIVPIVNLQNCNIDSCEFTWYRQLTAQERMRITSADRVEVDGNSSWLKLTEGLVYRPTEDDVAHHIKIVCKPIYGSKVGSQVQVISDTPVEIGPITCPFEKRHLLTKKPTINKDELRVVSYNILADLYADSEYSRSVLFAHCPAHALEVDYRRQLLLREILGYNADIVCLQELDKKEYPRTFQPVLKIAGGLDGVYDTKGGQVAEGLGTFFRMSKYQLVDSHRTVLSHLIECPNSSQTDGGDDSTHKSGPEPHFILKHPQSDRCIELLSRFKKIREAILSNEDLKKRFLERHTVIQTTLLKSKELDNKFILVANTHLYFAPDADHVRLLQGSVCVKYLEYIKQHYKSQLILNHGCTEPKICIVFCGDMNSTPDCGLYKLLTEGKISENLPDWSSNKDEAVEGLSVETDLRLSSAYSNLPYTNYTPGFHGCLDYIYYESNSMQCINTVPLPDHEDVIAMNGLPSDVFPSDHIALIANMKI